MNYWIIAGGLIAALSAAGHAFAGQGIFYRPIRAVLADPLQASVFSGMWHLITLHFSLSSVALLACGVHGRAGPVAWLVAAQFAGYALIYLALSLQLGNPIRLFQWLPFAGVALLAAIGATLSTPA